MPSIEITESDLEKANQQIAQLQANIAYFENLGGDNSKVISEIQADVKEIQAEARRYDILLNPGARPEICTLCNLHPKVETPDHPCPWCGCMLVDCQPPKNIVHWKVPGETVGKAMAEGKVPA